MRFGGASSSSRSHSVRTLVALALLVAALSPARAGGPYRLTASGEPFRWDVTQPIRYAVNAGPLGSRSHAWAVAAAQRAFQTWQEVPTARLQFQAASDLRQQIDGDSVGDFLDKLQPGDASPVLLDSDGSITDAVLGDGAADAVMGFSAPYLTDPVSRRILVSFTVVNGHLGDQFSDSFVLSTFVHELGHFLNLDHSQVNADELYDGDPDNDATAPEMFYRGPNDPAGLHQDDRAWISWLYPSAAAASTGAIRGRVLLPDGQMTGLQGIEVIARRVDDPRVTAVSGVSGFQFSGPQGGSTDPARLGEFLLPGLPPGSYTVEVQQLAFFPSISVPIGYLVGGPKLWHDGSTAQDMTSSSTPLVVSAGQEVGGIDIVLNGESLGEPKPVAEQEPNELPNAQAVSLPAVISGDVETGPGDGRSPVEQNGDLHDIYQVTLQQPMTVTAILSAARPQADLDLDVLSLDYQSFVVLAESTQSGTPPEVVQILLPAGRYYFGVHLAGTRGSAYTLRLLATPSPDPAPQAAPVWISYLTLGDVTASGATLHWQTTDNTPSIVYSGQPLHEIGSPTRVQAHSMAVTGLASAAKSTLTVFAPTATDPDLIDVPVTTARAARPDGEPRIVAAGKADFFSFFDFDIAEVAVHLTNPGDAEARQVQIDQVIPATGWKLLSEVYPGAVLPSSISVGTIGAGAMGDFVVRIVRLRGTADPAVKVHGSYADPAGTVTRF